jgi:hypothetical protein
VSVKIWAAGYTRDKKWKVIPKNKKPSRVMVVEDFTPRWQGESNPGIPGIGTLIIKLQSNGDVPKCVNLLSP